MGEGFRLDTTQCEKYKSTDYVAPEDDAVKVWKVYGWRIKVAAHLASQFSKSQKVDPKMADGAFKQAIEEICKNSY